MTNPATVVLDKEKVEKWIKNGAKPTDTVKSINRKNKIVLMQIGGRI